MPKIIKNLPHPVVSLSFLLAFLVYYFNASPLFFFSDVAWHVAAGDFILKSGAIPATDPWSYTANGATIWYNISWLWDVIIALVKKISGLSGLYFFSVLSYAFLIALLGAFIRKRKGIKDPAIFIALMVVMAVLWIYVSARPQICSYLLAVIFHFLLDKSRQDKSILQGLWVLPLLTSLWTNLHGGFLIGFTILAAYGLEAIITKNRAWFMRLLIIGICCLLAVFSGFYGIDIIHAVMGTLDTPIKRYITEWQSFSLTPHQLGISLAFIVFVLCSNSLDKKIPPADKILSFLWFFAAIISLRNFPVFVLLSAPYIAYNLSNIKKLPDLPKEAYGKYTFAATVVITIIMLLPVFPVNRDVVVAKHKVPVEEINYIKTNYPGKNFLNSYIIGGYMVYYGDDMVKPFMDGRAGTAYSPEAINDFISFLTYSKGWVNILDKYNIDGVIVSNDDRFVSLEQNGVFRNMWKKVFTGEAASVYVRQVYK